VILFCMNPNAQDWPDGQDFQKGKGRFDQPTFSFLILIGDL
jgi:hypothetical protein